MTLEDVAKIVGVSNATISRWESGAIENQRRDKVELLAKALRVSPGELMGWSENSPAPITDAELRNKLSSLSPALLEQFVRFLELAKADPDRALRYLAFANQELESQK